MLVASIMLNALSRAGCGQHPQLRLAASKFECALAQWQRLSTSLVSWAQLGFAAGIRLDMSNILHGKALLHGLTCSLCLTDTWIMAGSAALALSVPVALGSVSAGR
mgnify:CR=1 FL=1